MPQVTGILVEGKPLIHVTIADALPAPPSVSAHAEPVSFSLRHYKALLDTGADITCLCDNVIAECRLRSTGFIRMIGSTGPSLHDTYIVRLGIVCGDLTGAAHNDSARGIFQLEPKEAARIRSNGWFDVIIGTDILAQHELTLTRGGGFRLTLF